MNTISVSLDEIEQTACDVLVANGANESSASLVAHSVRAAEATGNKICGLFYVADYCKGLQNGGIDGRVTPEVSLPKTGCVSVDAKHGFAQSAFAKGLPQALTLAKQAGICALAIRHSHTCMALGYYTEQIANAGMIGLGFANSTAAVAPHGGNRPFLGTNPLAMAVPDPAGGIALQFDFSTSSVAMFKVVQAARSSEDIPEGWAIDDNGAATTDPAKALEGALLPTAGYKGWGLGLMVEILVAVLLGTAGSLETEGPNVDSGPHHNLGQFYILIDPDTFAGFAFADALKNLRGNVADIPGTRLPGSKRTRIDPVSLDHEFWSQLQNLRYPKA